MTPLTVPVIEDLESGSPSARLRAVMAVGTSPDPRWVDSLIERCAVEPDFQVRETLTWTLTRHPAALTVPKRVEELRSERAQALHTLSKIGDGRVADAVPTLVAMIVEGVNDADAADVLGALPAADPGARGHPGGRRASSPA